MQMLCNISNIFLFFSDAVEVEKLIADAEKGVNKDLLIILFTFWGLFWGKEGRGIKSENGVNSPPPTNLV